MTVDTEGSEDNVTITTPLSLSLVIPAYNEADRISVVLNDIKTHFTATERTFEVIVVNDGSHDSTIACTLQFQKDLPLRIFDLPRNRGKGAAVRTGMLNARGDRVLFLDADGSTLLSELSRVEYWLDQGYDIAIGSRALADPDTVVAAHSYRKVLGRIFHLCAKTLLPKGVVDSQCGFKLFTQSAAHELFTRTHCDGFSFDVEVLFLAQQNQLSWKEVAINWTHTPQSRLNLLSAPLSMFLELLSIAMRALFRKREKIYPIGYNSTLEVTRADKESAPQ